MAKYQVRAKEHFSEEQKQYLTTKKIMDTWATKSME